MNKSVYSFILTAILITLFGCAGQEDTEETDEYHGTVLSKNDTGFMFVEEYAEIEAETSVEEAFNTFGRDNVLWFMLDEDQLESINIGDQVIVHSDGNFEDVEPPRGRADEVETAE